MSKSASWNARISEQATLGVRDQASWQHKLTHIVETMREMSRQTDPQAMVRAYMAKMNQILTAERRISLSRRGLKSPMYRITRYNGWRDDINPWTQKDRLPLLNGGLLSELIYGNEPRIIDDLVTSSDDPAAEYLTGQKSLVALPLYDQGESLNMVVLTREIPSGFVRGSFPELVWMSALFGRATHTLVLADQLQQANAAMDHELKVVGDIQRSLLPTKLPE